MKKVFLAYRFHILIFCFSFLILSRFNFDADLGWHLAIGEHFLETGEVIRADMFSWTMPGYIWGNSYFAYQVLVAFLITKLGFEITVFLFASIASLAILTVLPRKISLASVLITFLGVLTAADNLGIRPHTISFLFFAVLLRIAIANFWWSKQYFWLWFLFFALWANFHNGYVVGLFFLGSLKTCDLILKLAKREKIEIADFLVNMTSGFAGTLMTPFGFELWLAILNDAFFPTMYFAVAEWSSIAVVETTNILYAALGTIFIYTLWRNFNRIGPSLVFISSFFFMMPFIGAYFVFFWVLIVVFLATRYLDIGDFQKTLRFAYKPKVKFGLMVCIFIIIAFLIIGCILSVRDSLQVAKSKSRNFPDGAIEFMKREGINKNVFNEYDWGGYLHWKYKGLKVFADGRMTGWHKDERSILADYLEIKNGNCKVASHYAIEALMVAKDSNVDCFVKFKKVYEDEIAEVWVKIEDREQKL